MFHLCLFFVSLGTWSLNSSPYNDILVASDSDILSAIHDNEFPKIRDNEYSSSRCPAYDSIQPCICREESTDVIVECKHLTSHDDLTEIFERVPGFTFTVLYVIDSTMLYFPSSVLRDANVRDINVTDCTFVSLFDVPPTSSYLKNIFIQGARFQQGFRWQLLSKLNLEAVMLFNCELKVLGTYFKQNVPKGIKYLWFQENQMTRLTHQPFENLNHLTGLALENQKFTSLEMLKFPKSIDTLLLQGNNLHTLPDGFFKDLPNLTAVMLGNNSFTTMRKELFLGLVTVHINDNPIDCNCNLKWVVTTKFKESIFLGICASPSNLKGKDIQELTASDFNYCG